VHQRCVFFQAWGPDFKASAIADLGVFPRDFPDKCNAFFDSGIKAPPADDKLRTIS